MKATPRRPHLPVDDPLGSDENQTLSLFVSLARHGELAYTLLSVSLHSYIFSLFPFTSTT